MSCKDWSFLDVSGAGRYVRLYGTQRGTGWGYSPWEFEVYARPGSIYLPLVLRPFPKTADATGERRGISCIGA